MSKKSLSVKWICPLVFVLGIALDQLTKWLVVTYMTLHQSIPIIKDVIHITYIRNRGAAFGMLAEHRWVFLVLSSVTIVAVGIYLFYTKNQSPLYLTSLSMILSGGVGNMIDRIALGEVIDFIDFTLIDFAIFNGADSFVCVGAALFFLSVLLDEIKAAKAQKAEASLPNQEKNDDSLGG